MIRRCLLSQDGRGYNTDTHFVSYAIQKEDGRRFLALQFQRGEGDEQFSIVRLVGAGAGGAGIFAGAGAAQQEEQKFRVTYNISSQEQLLDLLEREGVTYQMQIVDKKYLDPVIHNFSTTSMIRTSGAAQALNVLCDPVRKLIGVEINPVELILYVAEAIGDKKARGLFSSSRV